MTLLILIGIFCVYNFHKLNVKFKMIFTVSLLLLFTACVFSQGLDQKTSLPNGTLMIQGHKLNVEIAYTPQYRAQGLMFRQKLSSNAAMLFVFDENKQHCMWMKNTEVPLSVAFIDTKGVIVNIEDMQPQTTNIHCALKPVPFALETNLGWFKQHGFTTGTKMTLNHLLKYKPSM